MNVAEGDVLNPPTGRRIAMCADVGRVRYVRPKCAVLHQDIARVAGVLPTAAVDSNAVIRCAQEATINMDIAAAHHVDAIAPAFTGEGTDSAYDDILRTAEMHSIVSRIEEC